MRYGVAAVQFEPRFGDKAWNMEQLVRLTTEAGRAGARLVVLPEMATTGYRFRSRAEIAPLVEHIPDGPTVRTFSELAGQLSIHIVVGLPEVERMTGAYFNTAVLVGPQGYIGQYRKTHSYVDETRWARDGDLGIPVFETALGRIAMLICMDVDYMEPARVAALAGADLIAFPTNWENDQTVWRARALENGVYMVCANRWGEERGTRFCGHSVVIDPDGRSLNLLSGGDGVALAEVDIDQARSARTARLLRRRPEHYQELLLSSHLWHWRESGGLPPGRPTAVGVVEATDPRSIAEQLRLAAAMSARPELLVFPVCTEAPALPDMEAAAASLQCWLVWGEAGEDGAVRVRLAGPEGLVGQCGQVHGALEGRAVENPFPVFDLPWGRLGLMAAADLLEPEPARILAKRGADLIAAPAAWAGEHDRLLWKARCMENDTAIAIANAHGGSMLFLPGSPMQVTRCERSSTAFAKVDTGSEALRAKELLRKLQPRWYEPLVLA